MSKNIARGRPRHPHNKTDRHHILYQRRFWDKGYARVLRNAFVREVPVSVHRELHTHVLKDVPVPNGCLCKVAWEEYSRNKSKIDGYDVTRACAWLYVHIPDVEFRRAMQTQIDFFATRIKGGHH